MSQIFFFCNKNSTINNNTKHYTSAMKKRRGRENGITWCSICIGRLSLLQTAEERKKIVEWVLQRFIYTMIVFSQSVDFSGSCGYAMQIIFIHKLCALFVSVQLVFLVSIRARKPFFLSRRSLKSLLEICLSKCSLRILMHR